MVLKHGSSGGSYDPLHAINQGGSSEVLEGVTQDRQNMEGCSYYKNEIGSYLCWTLSYPNASQVVESPNFPLTGPTKFQVNFQKHDTSLTSYKFRYKSERTNVSIENFFL